MCFKARLIKKGSHRCEVDMDIRFGTEGWRAIIAESYTVENLRIVAQATAEHLKATKRGSQTVCVGYDTRFMSEHFAKTVAEVLAANRIHAILSTQTVPTCAVSRYTVAKGLSAGVMITASHNPAIYNGFKLKEAFGGSATSETVKLIERRIKHVRVRKMSYDHAVAQGWISRRDLMPDFLKGIRDFVDLKVIRRSRLHVIADPMHGAAGRIIESLLRGGRVHVETIHADPDLLFGGRPPEPIAKHLGELSQTVKRRGADIGIANDGDADRIGIIGPDGRWLNPGQVMCVLLPHLVATRGARGAVVKTVSSTMMINRMADDLNLRLLEVPVGFRHVAERMLAEDVIVGGEESGGIGVSAYLPERDGIANGLLLLEAMAVQGKKLSVIIKDLEKRYGRWHYGRQDLPLKQDQVDRLFKKLTEKPANRMAGVLITDVNRLDGVKLIGKDESWLLFRRSGTEPILRVYAESPKARQLPRLLELGVRWAKQA